MYYRLRRESIVIVTCLRVNHYNLKHSLFLGKTLLTILRVIVDTLCKMRITPVYAGHAKYVNSALLKIINPNLNGLVVQGLQNPSLRLCHLLYNLAKHPIAILTFVYGACFCAADTQAQGCPCYPSLSLPSSVISLFFQTAALSRCCEFLWRRFICLLCSQITLCSYLFFMLHVTFCSYLCLLLWPYWPSHQIGGRSHKQKRRRRRRYYWKWEEVRSAKGENNVIMGDAPILSLT